MTDEITHALEGLRERERTLELDAVAVRSRIEEIRELIALLDPPRRRVGRPRSVQMANPYTPEQMPLRVEGGAAHEPETESVA